jgi:FMN phosphatase YigB (HAD superfamily)
MKFKTILHTLALGLACTLSLSISASQQPEQKKPIIGVDLHDVLLDKDTTAKQKMWDAVSSYPRKKEIFFNRYLPIYGAKLIAMGAYHACVSALRKAKLTTQRGPTGEKYMAVALAYNNDALADLILKMSGCHTVNPAVAAILKQIRKQGYELNIMSNIGEYTLNSLFQKEDPAFREIFNDEMFDRKASQAVNYLENPPVTKPSQDYFKRYLERNGYEPKDIVFVDDDLLNCTTAAGLGMDSIQYKNPKQLAAEFRNRGIEVSVD